MIMILILILLMVLIAIVKIIVTQHSELSLSAPSKRVEE